MCPCISIPWQLLPLRPDHPSGSCRPTQDLAAWLLLELVTGRSFICFRYCTPLYVLLFQFGCESLCEMSDSRFCFAPCVAKVAWYCNWAV